LLTYPTLSSILALFGRRFYLSGSIRVSPKIVEMYKAAKTRWHNWGRRR